MHHLCFFFSCFRNNLFLACCLLYSLLFILPSVTLGQQKPAESCATDAIHAHKLATDPQYLKRHEEIEELIYQKTLALRNNPLAKTLTDGILTIPVVFHVVHNGEEGRVPEARIHECLNNLNDAFRNRARFDQGSGADPQITFCLAQVDPQGRPTTGINWYDSPLAYHQLLSPDLKQSFHWNTLVYVNIYIVAQLFGAAGYGTLAPTHGHFDDGIVMTAQIVGSPLQDYVFAHETGHYFNLYHVFHNACFNNNCLLQGDRVCDTRPSQVFNGSGCVVRNTCDTDAYDPSNNNPYRSDEIDWPNYFMDYNNWDCSHDFSPGQATRMRIAALNVRRTLWAFPDVCQNPPMTSCLPPRNVRTERDIRGLLTVSWEAQSSATVYEVIYVDAYTMTQSRTIVKTTSWQGPDVSSSALSVIRVRTICGPGDTSVFVNANYVGGQYPVACKVLTELNAVSGVITDGSGLAEYTPNSNCRWRIRVPTGPRIRIDIDSLRLDPTTNDYINIYNGTDSTGTLIYTLRDGRMNNPQTFVSTGSSLFIEFKSDQFFEASGWQIRYSETNDPPSNYFSCSGEVTLTQPSGTITDGSASRLYQNNLDCFWKIIVADTSFIVMRITELQTEAGSDFIAVYDGTTTADRLLGEFSGSIFQSDLIQTSGNEALIYFHSSPSVNEAGWAINYQSFSINDKESDTCAGLSTVNSPAGIISDGSGHSNYTNGVDCTWLIAPQGVDFIRFDLLNFDTERDGDELLIYDGSNAQAPLIERFSGQVNRYAFRSNQPTAFVVFRTNDSITAPGWMLRYQGDTITSNGAVAHANTPTFSLFPNPTNSSLTVRYQMERLTPFQFEIIDGLGRLVLSQSMEGQSGETQLDVSMLAAGIYTCRLRVDQEVFQHQKLVIIQN
jgi:hypothetical protein